MWGPAVLINFSFLTILFLMITTHVFNRDQDQHKYTKSKNAQGRVEKQLGTQRSTLAQLFTRKEWYSTSIISFLLFCYTIENSRPLFFFSQYQLEHAKLLLDSKYSCKKTHCSLQAMSSNCILFIPSIHS